MGRRHRRKFTAVFQDYLRYALRARENIGIGGSARAYMRQASVLVLDEPTAALDPEAELEVFRHFRTLVRGKTAFFIATAKENKRNRAGLSAEGPARFRFIPYRCII